MKRGVEKKWKKEELPISMALGAKLANARQMSFPNV
jgi:hypothetical protein